MAFAGRPNAASISAIPAEASPLSQAAFPEWLAGRFQPGAEKNPKLNRQQATGETRMLHRMHVLAKVPESRNSKTECLHPIDEGITCTAKMRDEHSIEQAASDNIIAISTYKMPVLNDATK